MTAIDGDLAVSAIATLLRHQLGPSMPRAKDADEARWEDDGGALTVEAEGWSHTISADAAAAWPPGAPWWQI